MYRGTDIEALRERIAAIRCFALDMDGTIYLGNKLLGGSLEFLRRIRETGRSFVFLTNNSSKSRKEYMNKLSAMGVEITHKELVSSGQATAEYLNAHHPGKAVYLLGTPALVEEFQEAGILLDKEHPEVVVTAFDTALDYEKLCRVCDLVREGLPYVATHPDFNCPTETGFIPDIGATHAFIHASAGRMPDKVVGKPFADIMECAFRQTGYPPEETVMVGDRLYTDIAVTEHVPSLRSILVLTGETAFEDLTHAKIQPHMVFDALRDITPLL